MIDRGKRSKTLSEVKLVENISKNLQRFAKRKSFLYINSETIHEYYNPFKLKEDNLSERNFQNQLSHPGFSHIEQECQESLISRKDSHSTKFEQRPQIFLKLGFRELV